MPTKMAPASAACGSLLRRVVNTLERTLSTPRVGGLTHTVDNAYVCGLAPTCRKPYTSIARADSRRRECRRRSRGRSGASSWSWCGSQRSACPLVRRDLHDRDLAGTSTEAIAEAYPHIVPNVMRPLDGVRIAIVGSDP